MSKRSDGAASAASIEDAFCEWRVKHRKNLSCQLLFYHVQCTPDNFIHIIIFILSQASAEQDICFLFRKLCILCIECAVFLIVDRIVRFVTLFPGRGILSRDDGSFSGLELEMLVLDDASVRNLAFRVVDNCVALIVILFRKLFGFKPQGTVFERPELLDVRLNDARNLFKNNTFYVVQSYGVPLRQLTDEDFSIARNSTIFFGYSFLYSRFYKRYTDTKAESGDFYENWYVSPERSYDSIFESLLSNRLFVQIQPWDRDGAVGVINAGIGNDAHHYYQFRLQDYMGSNEGANRNSTYVYGSIEGNVKRYLDWNADVKFHLFGYRRQDLSVGGDVAFKVYVRGRPMTLKGSLRHEIRTPGYWTESYFSNHFVWSNSFSKESETRFSVTFSAPQIGLELGGYQSLLGDRIYYGADQLPAQYGGTVTVSGLYAQKDFRFGGLHLNHRVLYQYSSAEEVVPVPAISAYLSYYFEFNVVKNVLRLQLGLDGRYNTSYYAFGYNPATAQFYNQREKKLGNYPMIDVFAAAKWKRMRILIKMQHLNENMFGDRNYFTVLHYPQNPRMFKLGVSWSFYD